MSVQKKNNLEQDESSSMIQSTSFVNESGGSQNQGNNLIFDDEEGVYDDSDSQDYGESPYSDFSPDLELAMKLSLMDSEGQNTSNPFAEAEVVSKSDEEPKESNTSKDIPSFVSNLHSNTITHQTITNLTTFSDDEDDEFEFTPPLPPKKRYTKGQQSKRSKKRLRLTNREISGHQSSTYDNDLSNGRKPRKPLPPVPGNRQEPDLGYLECTESIHDVDPFVMNDHRVIDDVVNHFFNPANAPPLPDSFSDSDDMSTPSNSLPNTPVEESVMCQTNETNVQNPDRYHPNISDYTPIPSAPSKTSGFIARPRRRKKKAPSSSSKVSLTKGITKSSKTSSSPIISSRRQTNTTNTSSPDIGLGNNLLTGFEDDDSDSDHGDDIVFKTATELSPTDISTPGHPMDFYYNNHMQKGVRGKKAPGGDLPFDRFNPSFLSSKYLIREEMSMVRMNLKSIRESSTKSIRSNSSSTPVPGQSSSSSSSSSTTSSRFIFFDNPYLRTIYHPTPILTGDRDIGYGSMYFSFQLPDKYSKKVIQEDFRNEEFLMNSFSSDLKVVYAFEKLMLHSKDPVIHWGVKCSNPRCKKEDFLGPKYVCRTCDENRMKKRIQFLEELQQEQQQNETNESSSQSLSSELRNEMKNEKKRKKKGKKGIEEEDGEEDEDVDYESNDILLRMMMIRTGMIDDEPNRLNRKKSDDDDDDMLSDHNCFSICTTCYKKRIEFHPNKHNFVRVEESSLPSFILELERLYSYFSSQNCVTMLHDLRDAISRLKIRVKVIGIQENQFKMFEIQRLKQKQEELLLQKIQETGELKSRVQSYIDNLSRLVKGLQQGDDVPVSLQFPFPQEGSQQQQQTGNIDATQQNQDDEKPFDPKIKKE